MFQSTPAYGGRPRLSDGLARWTICFNPRPRTAGDDSRGDASDRHDAVSIHARVRRATVTDPNSCRRLDVSIHARVRRATVGPSPHDVRHCSVSIHARVRRATSAADGSCMGSHAVSIHARVRRATSTVRRRLSSQCFNPRPRTAGDVAVDQHPRSTTSFQSTPAYGGRLMTSDLPKPA